VDKTRRRKKNSGGVIGTRLGLNMSGLDFERFAYRWINDLPARIQAKTKDDDWDIVKANGDRIKSDGADLGDAISQIVGANPDGSPMRAYLCRKPKSYFEDDQREKSEELDKQLAELQRGNTRDGSSQSDYVPNGGISVSRGA